MVNKSITTIFALVSIILLVYAGILRHNRLKVVENEPSLEFKTKLYLIDHPELNDERGYVNEPDPVVGMWPNVYRIERSRVNYTIANKIEINYLFKECPYCHNPYLASSNSDNLTFTFKNHEYLKFLVRDDLYFMTCITNYNEVMERFLSGKLTTGKFIHIK